MHSATQAACWGCSMWAGFKARVYKTACYEYVLHVFHSSAANPADAEADDWGRAYTGMRSL